MCTSQAADLLITFQIGVCVDYCGHCVELKNASLHCLPIIVKWLNMAWEIFQPSEKKERSVPSQLISDAEEEDTTRRPLSMGSVSKSPLGAYTLSFCSCTYLAIFFKTCKKSTAANLKYRCCAFLADAKT